MRNLSWVLAVLTVGCVTKEKEIIREVPGASGAPANAPGAPSAAVPPGQYTNHVGNPAAGSWGPDGTWEWKDPNSKEATNTAAWAVAAGVAGAAVGATAAHYLSKKNYQEKYGDKPWSPEARSITTTQYLDRRGKPISETEYRRRQEQSARDRAAHQAKKNAPSPAAKPAAPGLRDKRGNPVSPAEYERRQQQSARDKAKTQRAKNKPRASRSRRSRRP